MPFAAAGSLLVLSALACGGDSSPNPSPLVIEKATSKSGDGQTGPAGAQLPSELKVLITRDGAGVENVSVAWTTLSGGSLAPTSSKSDATGFAVTLWTLGPDNGEQTATATVSGATGSPLDFTATATGGTVTTTIAVVNNSFQPSNVTVPAGRDVTWEWSSDAVGHNVVPDDGATPATSGGLVDGPHSYTFTFGTPGVYHYYCAHHGGPGGIGMSGTVTVLTP